MNSESIDDLKSYLGFLLGMAVAIFSLAKLGMRAGDAPLLKLFGWSLSTWLGYLYAHYSINGKIIDGLDGYDPNNIRQSLQITGSTLGGFVLILGVVLGLEGLRTDSFQVTFAASTLFWTGYVVAHYSAREKLL